MRNSGARRQALIDAASAQFHERGIARSSLADVARAANVPPGNMFYYFRTKEELAGEVAASWTAKVSALLSDLESNEPVPFARIQALIARAGTRAHDYAKDGCPLAAIARDARLLDLSMVKGSEPLQTMSAWLERQFRAAGTAQPKEHATFVLATLQGAFALAHGSRDASIVREVERSLMNWLKQLAGKARAA